MITADWARHMARYNRWQNESLIAAADGLDDTARQHERGAFFGSIQRTFSHLLWGDTVWIARFDAGETTEVSISDSPDWVRDWADFKARRKVMDQRITDWTARLRDEDAEGVLEWYSGALGRRMAMPRAVCMMQVFNHQTHHRGQIHAMLTAAGADPGNTDIPFMPEEE